MARCGLRHCAVSDALASYRTISFSYLARCYLAANYNYNRPDQHCHSDDYCS